jgi:hypothetical protein
VADIEETAEGMWITIRKSKTDQEGAGQTIAIVRGSVVYPIQALKAWLSSAGIAEGAIFRRVNKAGKRAKPAAFASVIRHALRDSIRLHCEGGDSRRHAKRRQEAHPPPIGSAADPAQSEARENIVRECDRLAGSPQKWTKRLPECELLHVLFDLAMVNFMRRR